MSEPALHRIRSDSTVAPRIDVVFVHGLDGDYKASWNRGDEPEGYWPTWIAAEFPEARVWSLAYEVRSSSWKGEAVSLFDRGKNILAVLQSSGLGKHPIVFVAHSYGGLLIKQIMRQASDVNNQSWSKIFDSIRGIVFIATPHSGSIVANVAAIAKALRPSTAIQELKHSAPELRSLQEWFKENLDPEKVRVAAFYEMRDYKNVRVVAESSADPGIKGVTTVGLDDHHMDICKPTSKESLLHLGTSRLIKDVILDHPDRSRPTAAGTLLEESVAWCAAKWQALNVPRRAAQEFAGQEDLGAFPRSLLPTSAHPLRLVIGDIGTGKSLGLARFYQAGLRSFEENNYAPIPILLRAIDLNNDLDRCIRKRAGTLGDPTVQGAVVAIDLEDVPVDVNHLLVDARTIVSFWKYTRIIIASRPSPFVANAEEVCHLEPLALSDVKTLLGRILPKPIKFNLLEKLTPAVREAVRRPLFALFLGSYLRRHGASLPRSQGELVASLVEDALAQPGVSVSESSAALQRLAATITDHGGVAVSRLDLSSRKDIDALRSSRLVTERLQLLNFVEAIFTHWFAAQSLLDGTTLATDLCSTPERLYRWRDALIVAMAQANFDSATAILSEVIKKDLVFATDIVHAALASWSQPEEVPIPELTEFGRRAQLAVETWAEGLGPLKRVVAYRRDDGRASPLGIRIDKDTIYTAFCVRSEVTADVLELPQEPPDGWSPVREAKIGYQPAWVWKWAQDQLSFLLSAVIGMNILPLPQGILVQDVAWDLATKHLKRSAYFTAELPLKEIDAAIEGGTPGQGMDQDFMRFEYDVLNGEITRLRAEGHTMMTRPWPGPDLELSDLIASSTPDGPELEQAALHYLRRPWLAYSSQRLIVYSHIILMHALEAYRQLVVARFPRMAHRMDTFVLMPARLEGILCFREVVVPDGISFPVAILAKRFRPLAAGQGNEVELVIGNERQLHEFQDRMLEQGISMGDEIAKLRKGHAPWLTARTQSGVTTIFGPRPVFETVKGWIQDELKRIHWLWEPGPTIEVPASAFRATEEGFMLDLDAAE